MRRTDLERNNREVWRSPHVLGLFARREGWTDPGEARVMEELARRAAGRPILDVGVGAGRTLPYLRSLSDDYVAVDYLEEMVELTRSRHPGARVELGDARDLSGFGDGTFGLVVFSYNGIDGLAHEDRGRVYAAVARVLRPGGLFAFSTHNLDDRRAGRPPWDPFWFRPGNGRRAAAVAVLRLPRRTRSHRRLQALTARGDGWASLVDSAYDFSVVWHYVTVEELLRELRDAGFAEGPELYTRAGERLDAGGDATDSPWLHVIARKP
jgi:SAM-dependent methyltransferase